MPNPNHPKKGSFIKTQPIREIEDIKRIKSLLENKPRDLCAFTLGINTAYRANELLSLTVGQVRHLKVGSVLDVKQSKNRRYRATTINAVSVDAIEEWLAAHPDPQPEAALFWSQQTGTALTVQALSRMVKDWCKTVGLEENYASHSLRKTWGYHRLRGLTHIPPHLVLPSLMVAYGHSTQQQTLDYLCIQADEIANLYMDMEL